MTIRPIHCILLAIALLAGCARKPEPKPVVTAPAPRPVPPPGGATTSLTLPSPDDKGGYRTINSDVGAGEAIWHVRSALNVAALSCEGGNGRAIIADYNALLTKQKAVFAAAYKAEATRQGSSAALDRHMTQVYNYFAQPPVQARFCAAAGEVSGKARGLSGADFQAYSSDALQRLEAPFQLFYRAYAAWKVGAPFSYDSGTQMASLRAAPSEHRSAPWRIQLGAFTGRGGAEAALEKVRKRVSSFGSFKPHFEEASVKGLVRLQLGPVEDRQDAIRLCAAAAGAGLDCFPVSPSS